ncbi:hypothetical protein EI77_02526 [Prosthecobacter fusiformis]|uniref:Uncharacterized protein n=1 Tax=Prosthecobacter fusiformis TaxID=48464 RepID=A0A4R7RZM6_9BACT|nr:hypothetical protein [Prosthecobacter fusiformis]TDU71402.1 hypothetical protein EI77_02526 [Prosthecobacter fusiformis]
MERDFTEIPLRDEIPGPLQRRLAALFEKICSRLNGYSGGGGEKVWERHEICEMDVAHQEICRAISEGRPYAVGRLGGVEASVLMWALGIKAETGLLSQPLGFLATRFAATNAGIRPRNKPSYRTFAKLCEESLEILDCQGVWKNPYEASCLALLPERRLVDVETLAPSDVQGDHWMNALEGKRVLVVSPFASTIQSQIPKLGRVWEKRGWVPGVEFTVVSFPYLIDENCDEPWWQVYTRIASVIASADYDVGLFGCGGLGLLFAAEAKRSGKVGLHLGGHLQLLFGIYGKRHLEQEWFRKMINQDWVRPISSEIPKTSQRVENGCYW